MGSTESETLLTGGQPAESFHLRGKTLISAVLRQTKQSQKGPIVETKTPRGQKSIFNRKTGLHRIIEVI